jgi:hypothetical protein
MLKLVVCIYSNGCTGCPTRYRTQHFFNKSNTNKDIATKFEQEYIRCVRNEEECVCSVCLFRCNIFIGVRIIKEVPGSLANGTSCTFQRIQDFKIQVLPNTSFDNFEVRHPRCVSQVTKVYSRRLKSKHNYII